jgi:hypothetical protein
MLGQIIMYYNIVAKIVQLAKVLEYVYFYRNVESSKEKGKLVR